jgi:hypothetical protein
MDATDIATAREALRRREGISKKREAEIGGWFKGDSCPELILELPVWGASHGIEGVVWTALPAKFDGEEGRIPTLEEVLVYLQGLTGTMRDSAERYIRWAPQQIDTPYRRRIEAVMGWTCADA